MKLSANTFVAEIVYSKGGTLEFHYEEAQPIPTGWMFSRPGYTLFVPLGVVDAIHMERAAVPMGSA